MKNDEQNSNRSFDMLDFLLVIAAKKKTLLLVLMTSIIISYLGVLLFIENQYEATSTIVSSADETSGLLGSLSKSFDILPMKIGTTQSRDEMDKYNTIIYSRSSLEYILSRYNLYGAYNYDSTNMEDREKAQKKIKKKIKTFETDDGAVQITFIDREPLRAATVANAIVDLLNSRIIDLRISKSRENRLFLEQRLAEIRSELKQSEDSLKLFQEKTGMFEVTSQVKEIMSLYTTLETNIISKQVQLGILEKTYDQGSPIVTNTRRELEEYQHKLNDLNQHRQPGSLMLPLKSMPNVALDYLRLYRTVEINSSLLKFLVPIYEQAKIDEKKDYPILQVIDKALPPSKRSYPPRVLFSICIAFFVLFIFVLFYYIRKKIELVSNPRLLQLIKLFYSKSKR
jgi:tyrosine-protein kinase Etk/Wzc